MTPFTSDDVERIAQALSDGRRIFRSGDGRKTFCPLCQAENRRRRSRPTLSITARRGKILVHCHRCRSEGPDIIRELVRLELLPNLFRETSDSLALVDRIHGAIRDATWSGTCKATDRLILIALTEILRRCRKERFGASIRDVALRARVKETTAWRSLRRLADSGWLEKIEPARGEQAAIWRLRVPRGSEDRAATLRHARREDDRLFLADPFFRGADRAGCARLAAPVPHDVFRWGKGLGAVKGQIYSLLATPLKPIEIALTLGYKYSRNVRIHLQRLAKYDLVRRRSDGRYELSDADLNAVAVQLGVFGASEKQRARDAEKRSSFHRLHELFQHWKKLGEVVDPETGAVLESGIRPSKSASIADFRRAVRSGRMHNPVAAPASQLATEHELISLDGAPLAAAVLAVEKTFPGARLAELG
jgi:hypothetical protein